MVPAEAALWPDDPFAAVTSGGWMTGRGAGDMKGGFAMGLLAVAALRRAMPGALSGELGFLSVIEEECTGNGTLAACQAGVLGDAVILLEPTDLGLLLGGVGVLWVEIEIEGVPAHAEAADRAQSTRSAAPAGDPAGAGRPSRRRSTPAPATRPSARSPGPTTSTSAWSPPATGRRACPRRARLRVRVGFPRGWTRGRGFERVSAAVLRAAAGDAWLAGHPPGLRQTGFRAEGYLLPADHWLAERDGGRARQRPRRRRPSATVIGGTTDARYYLNQFGVPALAYGPRGAQHPRHRRGGRTGQHRDRGQDPGQVHRRLLRRGGLPGEPLGQEARR